MVKSRARASVEIVAHPEPGRCVAAVRRRAFGHTPEIAQCQHRPAREANGAPLCAQHYRLWLRSQRGATG